MRGRGRRDDHRGVDAGGVALVGDAHGLADLGAALGAAVAHGVAHEGAEVVAGGAQGHQRALEGGGELGHGLVAVLGILLQALEEDLLHVAGEVRVLHARGEHGARDDVAHGGDVVVAEEGVVVGGEPVEHDPQREDVGAAVDGAAARLLRRHVRDLALELPGGGLAAGAADGLGHAEVDQLHDAVVRAEDVLRGDVAVDEHQVGVALVAQLVRGVEGGAGLHADAQGEAQRHLGGVLPEGLAEDGERLPVDPLHDDVEDLVLLPQVEDLGHVGVVDLGGERGLVEEHLLELGILAQGRQHRLDGHRLVEAARAALPRRPHRGHPALGDGDEELVAPQHHPRDELVVAAHRTRSAGPATVQLYAPPRHGTTPGNDRRRLSGASPAPLRRLSGACTAGPRPYDAGGHAGGRLV